MSKQQVGRLCCLQVTDGYKANFWPIQKIFTLYYLSFSMCLFIYISCSSVYFLINYFSSTKRVIMEPVAEALSYRSKFTYGRAGSQQCLYILGSFGVWYLNRPFANSHWYLRQSLWFGRNAGRMLFRFFYLLALTCTKRLLLEATKTKRKGCNKEKWWGKICPAHNTHFLQIKGSVCFLARQFWNNKDIT